MSNRDSQHNFNDIAVFCIHVGKLWQNRVKYRDYVGGLGVTTPTICQKNIFIAVILGTGKIILLP